MANKKKTVASGRGTIGFSARGSAVLRNEASFRSVGKFAWLEKHKGGRPDSRAEAVQIFKERRRLGIPVRPHLIAECRAIEKEMTKRVKAETIARDYPEIRKLWKEALEAQTNLAQ